MHIKGGSPCEYPHTILLRSFLQSIGFPLSSASPTYEDNQGTIKLIRTHRLTDTVRHHAVKIAWLNEHYLNNNLKMANTKTMLMLVDCNTKPVNRSQLYNQISYVIGQHFYPPPSSQHFHDLQLDTYSWYQRQASITKKTSSSTTDFSSSIPG